MKRVLLSWSSGKDSAWTLHHLRQQADYELVGLLTTLNSEFDRVAMHGTRRSVLEAQSKAAGLPLWTVPLPWPCSNEDYERRMSEVCARAVAEGVTARSSCSRPDSSRSFRFGSGRPPRLPAR
jgi:diphthamide synthase (EF-2-diphthine--ammonia ligase)